MANNILANNLKKVFFVTLTAALIVSGFFVAYNAFAAHTTTVTLNPESVFVKKEITQPYSFTINNTGGSAIYKITANIPNGSGFSINPATITCPNGWTKDEASNNSKAVCITDGDPANPHLLTSGSSK